MAEMLFKLVGKSPVPVKSRDDEPAGTVFTLDEAVVTFKWPRIALEAIHETFVTEAELEKSAAGHSCQAIEAAMADWQSDPEKVIIRQNDFGKMGDADFAWFLARAKQRNLDPWKREVFAEFTFDASRKRTDLHLIISIEKMRAIAHETGLYAGFGKMQYEPDNKVPMPDVAYAPVKKWSNGVIVEFFGEAFMNEYYPGDNSGTLWDEKPKVCLRICAERAGLAIAFPQCAGLYVSYEFTKSKRERRGGSPGPDGTPTSQLPPPPVELVVAVDAETGRSYEMDPEYVPQSLMELHRMLSDVMGMKNDESRNELLAYVRQQQPGLEEYDDIAFYGAVIAEKRKNRRRWA